MIRVHHLDRSRSFRILWLLEELSLDYEIVQHWRDAQTRLAPPSLEGSGGAGKAPMIEDDGLLLVESGAIIDYLIRRHGGGRLTPDPASRDYDLYQMWLHYAEGSAMLPVMLNLYLSRGAETPALRQRLDDEIARHRDVIAAALAGHDYLLGGALTGADINLLMPAELLDDLTRGDAAPAIVGWVRRCKARPAYARAIERGGDPDLGARRRAS